MAHPYAAGWEVTRALLSDAHKSLAVLRSDADYQNRFALYREFMDHIEMELALDVLVDMAHEFPCPEATWKLLATAAESMGLKVSP